MKTNLSIILLTAIFAFSLSMDARAQDTKFGLKGGAALYSTTASVSGFGESIEEKSGQRFGFAAGLFIESPFSDIVSGQIEALYVQKGGKDDLEDAEVEDGDLTLSYVDVPVMIKANIPLDGNVQPFVYGGGFAGYLLDAQAESDGQSVEEEGFELKDVLKDVNYGLVFGGGVSFGNISVDIRYDLGLANIFDSESDLIQELLNEFGETDEIQEIEQLLDGIEITTSGLQFTVGISF
ncbi:MAG: porin family protein [Balneolaceae bacterium]|nr:porin family protein [Balneolaceae bacterium]